MKQFLTVCLTVMCFLIALSVQRITAQNATTPNMTLVTEAADSGNNTTTPGYTSHGDVLLSSLIVLAISSAIGYFF